MSVCILKGEPEGACFYCSTSDWAFGPLFKDVDEAASFLEWLDTTDPRTLGDAELDQKYGEFRAAVADGWYPTVS